MPTQEKNLKSFEIMKCPHCEKEFYAGVKTTMSSITSISTINDIKRAKEEVERRLEDVEFCNETDKQEVIAYLNNENTIIDFSDVELMLSQVKSEQIAKIKQQNESINI